MNKELTTYLKIEATVAAAFNFFISGMVAALIHHKADMVATDTLNLAIDLTITCLLTFTITAVFCRASLKRTNTAGILNGGGRVSCCLSRLFQRPAVFGVVLGLLAAAALFALTAPIFALLETEALPFHGYMALKTVSCALLGGSVTLLGLYAGMCGTEEKNNVA